jgi:hypothetical protein
MERETRLQLIWGIGVFVLILAGAVGIGLGVGYATTHFGAASQVSGEPSESIAPETTPARQANIPEVAQPELPVADHMMYFPLAFSDQYGDTEVTIKNNEAQEASGVELTLVHGNEFHTYQPIRIDSDGEYDLRLSNLANQPEGTSAQSPATLVISSSESLAAVAEIKNHTGITTRPFAPQLKLKDDFNLPLSLDTNAQTKQNVLVLTNLSSTITEYQISATKLEGETEILETAELIPYESKIINLGLKSTERTNPYQSIVVTGSSPSLLAALAKLDKGSGTWDNIVTD